MGKWPGSERPITADGGLTACDSAKRTRSFPRHPPRPQRLHTDLGRTGKEMEQRHERYEAAMQARNAAGGCVCICAGMSATLLIRISGAVRAKCRTRPLATPLPHVFWCPHLTATKA
jgi:hypothetical protein